MTHGRRRAASLLAVAVLVAAGVGIAKASRLQLIRVISNSMSPALDRGDWTLTRGLSDRDRRAVGRQDIVLFRFPPGTAGHAVKRVVAIGEDEVAISDRTVAVNGRVIPIAGAPSERAARRRVETVPAGHVFLLGDNAAASIDSRSVGAVPNTELVARVLFVIPRRTLLLLVGIAAISCTAACGLLVARRLRTRRRLGLSLRR